MSDVLTPARRKKNIRHIKSKDTKIEVVLRKEWINCIRYFMDAFGSLHTKKDCTITDYWGNYFCDYRRHLCSDSFL